MHFTHRFAALVVAFLALSLAGSVFAAGGPARTTPSAAEPVWGIPPEVRAREAFGDLLPEVLAGEILVKADAHKVVIALDERDAQGRTDGRVDHLFLFATITPLIPSFTLSDPDAAIEYRPTGLRILSHTKQREINLQINGAPPALRPKQSVYSYAGSQSGYHLYRYSGKAVKQLAMAEVSGEEAEILTSLREKSALLPPDSGSELEDYKPDQTDGPSGSSCKSLCSKSCVFGSCSAACIPGFCAKCECLGDPPPLFPSCSCS